MTVRKAPNPQGGKEAKPTHPQEIATVWIPGVPVAKGRPRVVHTRSGASYTYSPKKTAEAQEVLRQRFMVGLRDWHARPGVPIGLILSFRFGNNPGTWVMIGEVGEGRTERPDLDNLVKLVMDALAPWLHDDAQIVSIEARKE